MSGPAVMRELHNSVSVRDHSAIVACTGQTDSDTLDDLRCVATVRWKMICLSPLVMLVDQEFGFRGMLSKAMATCRVGSEFGSSDGEGWAVVFHLLKVTARTPCFQVCLCFLRRIRLWLIVACGVLLLISISHHK